MTTTTAVNNTNSGYAPAQTASDRASKNYNDFLKLLTVQLQNQDPTKPTDTDQLTQQIATLSQVEQQIATNDKLEQILSAYTATQSSNAVSYIGKQVDAKGNAAALVGGAALMAYSLDREAVEATVTITDKLGRVVFSSAASTAAGRNQLLWDGTDLNGNQLPDGEYKFSIKATDSSGATINNTTYTTGIVSAIDMTDGKTTLSIGELKIPLEDILSVRGFSTYTPPDDDTASSSEPESTQA